MRDALLPKSLSNGYTKRAGPHRKMVRSNRKDLTNPVAHQMTRSGNCQSDIPALRSLFMVIRPDPSRCCRIALGHCARRCGSGAALGRRQLADTAASTVGGAHGSGAAAGGGNARMERAIRRLAPSADDGRRHPRRRRRFRQLPRQSVAGGGAARHRPRSLRAFYRRPDAGPEHHGLARCPAGVQQIAVGLSRHPGQRRTHRPRPRDVGAICRGLRRGRARLRRRPLHHRRDLGRGIRATASWAATVRCCARRRRSPASAAAAIISARSFSPRSKSWRAATSSRSG